MSASIARIPRRHARERLTLLVEVSSREDAQTEWKEIAKTVEISPLGMSLKLKRQVEYGQLVRLSLPMPRHLRCFDKHTPLYIVWGVVRYIGAKTAEKELTVGIAFIGKRPPASFAHDPSLRYEIAPAPNGMWHLCEMPKRKGLAPDKVRRFPRVYMAIGVTLEILDAKGRTIACEKTMTETVSRRGAGVLTSLDVVEGQRVRLTSAPQMAFTAVVRARRRGADGRTRLSLAFVDKEWKIEGVK